MKRWSVGAVAIALVVAVSWLPARAWAEGSTLGSVKTGACALMTEADAERLWNVPMQVEPGVPGRDFPGRTCLYRPLKPDAGRHTVEFRLLDAGEWAALETRVFAKGGTADVNGVGDEAYVVTARRGSRVSALVLFARRGSFQFSVRVAGTGVRLTEALKEVARSVAQRR
jgi:hypothetical protein